MEYFAAVFIGVITVLVEKGTQEIMTEVLRAVSERSIEHSRAIYVCFVDYRKLSIVSTGLSWYVHCRALD